jgi:hypothetical protein
MYMRVFTGARPLTGVGPGTRLPDRPATPVGYGRELAASTRGVVRYGP